MNSAIAVLCRKRAMTQEELIETQIGNKKIEK